MWREPPSHATPDPVARQHASVAEPCESPARAFFSSTPVVSNADTSDCVHAPLSRRGRTTSPSSVTQGGARAHQDILQSCDGTSERCSILRWLRTRIRFDTDPSRYRHWRLDVDGPRRDAHDGGRSIRRSARRLRAEAELVRPRSRHRAPRRVAASSVRTSRRQGRRHHRRARQGVLRRCEHPDAGDGVARAQGRVLQVHERNTQRHRGDVDPRRSGRSCRGQRNRRGRRVRARARVRRDPARGRSVVGSLAARGPVARGACPVRAG